MEGCQLKVWTVRIAAICIALWAGLDASGAAAERAEVRRDWPGARRLFVGTNYQPVDRSPVEGQFDFSAFDRVMDQMQAAGIRVLIDIPGQPDGLSMSRRPRSRRS
jgi:beta-galactosidase